MRTFLPFLSLLASVAIKALAADELKIDVTLPVECDRKTKNGDSIHVHYRGKLRSSGEEFDSSYKRGKPFSFQLGAGQVITGWDEGLLDMCIGEKRVLTIGPSKAYGQQGQGSIPGNATLIFDTELMGIRGVSKPGKIGTKPPSDAETGKRVKDDKEDHGEEVVKAAGDIDEGVAEEVEKILDNIAKGHDHDHEEL